MRVKVKRKKWHDTQHDVKRFNASVDQLIGLVSIIHTGLFEFSASENESRCAS